MNQLTVTRMYILLSSEHKAKFYNQYMIEDNRYYDKSPLLDLLQLLLLLFDCLYTISLVNQSRNSGCIVHLVAI